jgi:seryl-tRNA synthetase
MVEHIKKFQTSFEITHTEYQTLCAGDMGFTYADIDLWFWSFFYQQDLLEISSVSNFKPFQANQMFEIAF